MEGCTLRNWKLLVLLLAFVVSLSACSTSKPAQTPDDKSPAPSKQDPVELQVWTRFPEMEKLLKDLGSAYTQQHPNVKVTVTLFPQRALDEKLAVALPAGQAGDIIEIDTISVFQYYINGQIEPVPQDFADELRKVVPKDAIADTQDEKGVLYTTPFFMGVQAIYYNKDHFAEAGLKEPPATMDQLMDYARKLTKYDANGKVTRAGFSLRKAGGGYGVAEKFWALAMVPNGITLVERSGNGWKANYGTGMEKAIKFYVDALHKYKVDSFDLKSDAEGFGLGLSAMFQRESYVIDYLAKNAPTINYGVFMMPKGESGHGSMGSFSSLGVAKASKHKAEAFEFIKFAMSKENQVKLLEDTGWLPLRTDADYTAVTKEKPAFEAFLKSLNTPGYKLEAYPKVPVALEIGGKMGDILMPAFQNANLVDNDAEIAKIAKQIEELSTRILKENDLLAK